MHDLAINDTRARRGDDGKRHGRIDGEAAVFINDATSKTQRRDVAFANGSVGHHHPQGARRQRRLIRVSDETRVAHRRSLEGEFVGEDRTQQLTVLCGQGRTVDVINDALRVTIKETFDILVTMSKPVVEIGEGRHHDRVLQREHASHGAGGARLASAGEFLTWYEQARHDATHVGILAVRRAMRDGDFVHRDTPTTTLAYCMVISIASVDSAP